MRARDGVGGRRLWAITGRDGDWTAFADKQYESVLDAAHALTDGAVDTP